jgi:hypothetical protein
MPDTPNLRPATRDELTRSLSFALRFNGRRRIAQITVERLVEYLERAGYVVLCKPAADQHGAPGNHAEWIDQAIKLQRGEWDRH